MKGSGPDGRIIAKDVESFVPSAAPPPTPSSAAPVTVTAPLPGAVYTDIPLTNLRKV